MPVFKNVNKNFFKKWTPEMAYVLGFFAADGYITVNRRGGHFFCFQIKEKIILEKFKKILNSEHKIAPRNNGTIFRLQIGSIEICRDLENLGFGAGKTQRLKIPQMPKKYFPHFVRGYFDGDGNIWMGKIHNNRGSSSIGIRTSFTSGSGEFLLDLRQRLNELGLGLGCYYKGPTGYFRLSYSSGDSKKLYRVMYFCYSGIDICLERKRKVFEKFIKLRL